MCAVWESTGREGYTEVKRGAKSCVGNRMSIVICCVLVRSHTQGEAFFLFKHFCYLTSELSELLEVVNTLILFHFFPLLKRALQASCVNGAGRSVLDRAIRNKPPSLVQVTYTKVVLFLLRSSVFGVATRTTHKQRTGTLMFCWSKNGIGYKIFMRALLCDWVA